MHLILTCFLALVASRITQAVQDGRHDSQHVTTSKPVCTVTASGGDDAPRFLHAVKSCRKVVIPKHTTLNIASRLNMTETVDRHINLQGTIRFAPDLPYWTGNAFYFSYQNQITFWILGGKNIHFDGGGTLDGAGQTWYDAIPTNKTILRPIVLTLYQAANVTVKDIRMINGPEWVNLVNEGSNIVYDNITIDVVSTSANGAHNSDGWDIYRSDNVVIKNSLINNGDDCVSFKPNSTNIIVSNLNCNGSHGISVGSLGQYPGVFDIVENVTISNIIMSNAQNGARIKAWAGPAVGGGRVKNITFNHFVQNEVEHPVIIDQCYFTNATMCSQFPSNTYIQDIWFNDVSGTSAKSIVAQIGCSPDGRCSNINVNDLALSYPPGVAQYSCQNVELNGNAASLFPECTVT